MLNGSSLRPSSRHETDAWTWSGVSLLPAAMQRDVAASSSQQIPTSKKSKKEGSARAAANATAKVKKETMKKASGLCRTTMERLPEDIAHALEAVYESKGEQNYAPAGGTRRTFNRAAEQKLRVGSMCSGYNSESLALQRLGVPFTHVFSAEKDRHVQLLQKAVHPSEEPHGKVEDMDPDKLGDIDVLVAGFPCQSFSAAGPGRGAKDPRGLVVFYVLNVFIKKKPRLLLLENVRGLKRNHKPVLDVIVRIVTNAGYSVDVMELDGKDSMIPHSRPRLWISAIRNDSYFHKFLKPQPLKFHPLLRHGFVDLHNKSVKKCKLHRTGSAAVLRATRKLQKRGVNIRRRTIAINVEATRKYCCAMVECVPCITASRGRDGGHYILQRESKLSLEEIGKLMGIDEGIVVRMVATGVPACRIGEALGNGQSLNVLERLLARLLYAAGLVEARLPDVWESASSRALQMPARPMDTLKFVDDIRGSLR